MTEEVHDSEPPKSDVQDIEARVEGAMRSRVSHFKEQADSLTFEGVRRLLEEDLGLEKFALDVHKRYVKQCLLKNLQEAEDGDALSNSAEAKEEGGKSPEQSQSRKVVKEPGSNNADNKEDSPVMGLLQKKNGSETKETEGNEDKEHPSESTIKKSVRKRAAYIKANSEKITMAGLRRLLEEDLKIEKYTLDPYKKLISGELDEVLRSFEFSKPMTASKKKTLNKSSGGKASKKGSSGGDSDSSDSEIQEEEDVAETKKKPTSKGKTQNSKGLKKRKRPETDTKTSSKKQSKAAKTVSKENSDAEDSGLVSEDGHSQSSDEKSVKKKDVSTPAHGRRVEHLKAVIKSCGMSVPPSVYKKVKQVSENKREAQLIKELEGILSKEGLSSNPSEKEIKDVKKRKEREKELEGIDMSNIVSTSRRRSTTSFVPPPKPVIPDISESEESEESDDEDDDDNVDEEEEGNDDEGGNDNDDGDDDGSNDNQSEQGNEEKREDGE